VFIKSRINFSGVVLYKIFSLEKKILCYFIIVHVAQLDIVVEFFFPRLIICSILMSDLIFVES